MSDIICRDCGNYHSLLEDYAIDGEGGLCVFCFCWAITMIAAYRHLKRRSPTMWAKELRRAL